jgi:hypothetical protein
VAGLFVDSTLSTANETNEEPTTPAEEVELKKESNDALEEGANSDDDASFPSG